MNELKNLSFTFIPSGMNFYGNQLADARTEQLLLTDQDGTRYLVSSHNCILIEDN